MSIVGILVAVTFPDVAMKVVDPLMIPMTAPSLARHSAINLTMNVSISLTVQGQASALAALPAVPHRSGPDQSVVPLKETGTNV